MNLKLEETHHNTNLLFCLMLYLYRLKQSHADI